jgi:uncharacterized membrane protein (UPF0182 family)
MLFDAMDNDPEPFEDDELPAALTGQVRRRRPRLLLLLVVIGVVLVTGVGWIDLSTDWMWYESVGYAGVFSTMLWTKLAVAAIAAVFAAAFVYGNLWLALRLAPGGLGVSRILRIDGRPVELPDAGSIASALALPVAGVAGLVAGSVGWASWETVLLWLHGSPFGVADPVFGRDVAFYVFTMPLLELVASFTTTLVILSLVVSMLVYASRGAVYRMPGATLPSLDGGPRAHAAGLVAALAVALAADAYLATAGLVLSDEGPFAGAGYTDLHATLPILRARAVCALLAAALAIASAILRRNGPLVLGVGLYVLTIVAGAVYPSTVQRFSVAPNELAKEAPYIERNIAATRLAFGLEAIEERELSGEKLLTAADVEENRPTIDNIRLWDQQPLLDTFAQIQEIRTYYEFQSVDNDRYRVGGQLKQVMLSARELAPASLPNRNWINERLTFTHGYGLTLGPVTEKTPEGLPVLWVRDIPPAVPDPALAVTRPQIYFGELPTEHVYVRTKTPEFDYPAGDQNASSTYDGADGVSIGSTWRQLLFAMRLGDMKLLLSDAMTPESRVLLYRGIRERLALVAPYLRFDDDPYLVVSEGRLVWMADAYTATDRYPYAQRYGGVNYIRNSVKATVDAYDGTVRLYMADETDPIVRTYAAIFPGTLRPLSEMPASMRAHVRYPEDIFRLQCAVYATYHMNSAQVLYNKEDQWAVASSPESPTPDKDTAMSPYYTIMRLPGEREEEFILMLPFTPQRKDNLASWMVARADGENYGKLLVYRFPKQRLVFGPKQIAARINQDPEISRQLSLWNQRGSQVGFGQLMVIPIDESLVYVQPLYLRAESGKIPELRRVIVAVENRIAMEETLDASLERVFGAPPAKPEAPQTAGETPPPAETAPPGDLAAEARQHYDRAVEAQRSGDWATYGEELKRLGEVLDRMAPRR